MEIREMTHQASFALLKRIRLGRLACSHEGQPYVTPAFFAFEDRYLYSFSTLGQKILWMRANPMVCVELDEIENPQEWSTVIVTGRYQELTESDETSATRERAWRLLQMRPIWWEPAYVKTTIEGAQRPIEGTYFRIVIDKISGRRSVPDASPGPGPRSFKWLGQIFPGRG